MSMSALVASMMVFGLVALFTDSAAPFGQAPAAVKESSVLSVDLRLFTFTVQHVFYIKPPVDRVMLVGIVEQGTVRPGDGVFIHASGKVLRATVEAIERIRAGQIPSAKAGDQVALRFAGVPADQVKPGDRITKADGT